MGGRKAGFVSGFVTATVVWMAGAAGLWAAGWLELRPTTPEAPAVAATTPTGPEEPSGAPPSRKLRGRLRRGQEVSGASGSASARPRDAVRAQSAPSTVGDDLREGEARVVDGARAGGEQQLDGAEIDRAFDAAMPRIRRCLLLVPDEGSVSGRLVFGLRIAGSGRVTAVNLSGPAALVGGEAGDCLRAVVRTLSFPRFDGPEMLVRYPIEFE
jgi:hypothetical protein